MNIWAQHQGRSLLFPVFLTHSTCCLCLVNNYVVLKALCTLAHRERWKEKFGCEWPNTKHAHLAQLNVGRTGVWLCVWEYVKSVRFHQSLIHQTSNNNRSNPAMILLLRLWCSDIIGNYGSATTKCCLDADQVRENAGKQNLWIYRYWE